MPHSPEPWSFTIEDGFATIDDANDNCVLAGDGWCNIDQLKYIEELKANYARIVACVNFCKGLSTERLQVMTQKGGLLELVGADAPPPLFSAKILPLDSDQPDSRIET